MFAKIIKFQLFTRGPHVFARECKGTLYDACIRKGCPMKQKPLFIWANRRINATMGQILGQPF